MFKQDEISRDERTHGATFVPIILGSNKMTITVGTGQQDYWPVYMSIGNLHNNIRWAHGSGVDLLGFLAIPKGTCCCFSSHIATINSLQRQRNMTTVHFGSSKSNFFMLPWCECLHPLDLR